MAILVGELELDPTCSKPLPGTSCSRSPPAKVELAGVFTVFLEELLWVRNLVALSPPCHEEHGHASLFLLGKNHRLSTQKEMAEAEAVR